MAKTDLTAQRLRELFNYNPETGVFTRLLSRSNAKAGDVAGHVSGKGYAFINVDGVRIQAHRLAWLFVTGAFPVGEIDHANGIRSDNRFSNLREATRSENMGNQRAAHRNSRTGVLGVSQRKNGRWSARIYADGVCHQLGCFGSSLEAEAAYLSAKKAMHALGEVARDSASVERTPRKQSASGLAGAHWSKQANKWMARIMTNGNRRHLGFFDSAQQAHDAYMKARQQIG